MKTQVKVTNESDDEIPQLVPKGKNPVKENVEVQKHITGKKSPNKSPGPKTPQDKKRKALMAPEIPDTSLRKKPKMGQEKKQQRKSSPGKTDSQRAGGQALHYCNKYCKGRYPHP